MKGNEWHADAGYNPCMRGVVGACSDLLGTVPKHLIVHPPAAEQLRYGFKPLYWSNSHHFFAMFAFGYTGGRLNGIWVNEIWEELSSKNPADITAGNNAAVLGAEFGAVPDLTIPLLGGLIQGIEASFPPVRLATTLAEEMCLSHADITRLLGK